MAFQDSRRKGILRLMLARDQCDARGEEMAVEALRFDALRDAEPTRAVSAFNLFQTPDNIASQMVLALGDLSGKRVLEPSAGLGRIYRAVRHRFDCPMVLVEVAPQCAAELFRETRGDDAATLIQDDFLACHADRLGGLFDCVIMNPPFKQGLDIKHIRHAISVLAHGGQLVSLCYAGVRQRQAFSGPEFTWDLLPAGSFRQEGTRADIAMISYTHQDH